VCSRQNDGERMSELQQAVVRNRLLAALPPSDFAALADHLQPTELELKQVLYEPGQTIRTIYFAEGGMVSHIAPLENGQSVEVGVVGREGLAGLPALLGASRAVTEALIQMEGRAWCIRPDELRAAFEQSAAIRSKLLRYAQAFHVQVRSATGALSAAHHQVVPGRAGRCRDRRTLADPHTVPVAGTLTPRWHDRNTPIPARS
jgi:CRP-like cAMP-binding protein